MDRDRYIHTYVYIYTQYPNSEPERGIGDRGGVHPAVALKHPPLHRPNPRLGRPRRNLLLQDRNRARGGGDTGGAPRGGDHVPRAGHAAHGGQERNRAILAIGRDAR